MTILTERAGLHTVDYLKDTQYATGVNLTTRIGFYERYRNPEKPSWNHWVVSNLDLEGKELLELGGGTGKIWEDTKSALPRSCRIAVTDLSEGMVRTARQNIGPDPRFTFRVVDAQQLPFREDTFDATAMFLMLYHVPADIRPIVYGQVKEIVRPGGSVYTTTGSQDHFKEIWQALEEYDPSFPCWGKFRPVDFNLETGLGELGKVFDDVTVRTYEDTLQVTDGTDLAAYVISKTPPELVPSQEKGKLESFMRRKVAENGGIFPVTVKEGLIIGKNHKKRDVL